jgi:hypothetical protein
LRRQLICFLTLISSKLIWISAAYVAPASAIENMIVNAHDGYDDGSDNHDGDSSDDQHDIMTTF